jgi:large repetitive protein
MDVVVTNYDGASAVVPGEYSYIAPATPAPALTEVSPDTGPASGGTPVIISGSNFAAGAAVKIGGVLASNIIVASDSSITAVTPAHAAGAADVVVTDADGQQATLVNGFTYTSAPAPAPGVSSISPGTGPTTGGTNVTISGADFQPGAGVSIGGTAATSVAVDSTTITAITPAHSAGSADVVVINSDGQSGTFAGGYIYTAPAPALASVTPNSGPTGGGTSITINGSGFVAGASVNVGGILASNVSVASGTAITATTPAHAAGPVSLIVTNSDGQSATRPNAFTYMNTPPTVSLTSPANGASFVAPASITVSAAAADNDGTIARVDFYSGATLIGTDSTSPFQIVWGNVAVGSYSITAAARDNAGATTSSNDASITVNLPPPNLVSIAPNSGSLGGGNSVTLTGTAFRSGIKVSIGGVLSTSVKVTGSTTITAVTPAHAAGPVNVVVTNLDGQSSTIVNEFNYILPPSAPTGLMATAISSNQINLAWVDNSSDEDGFKIEQSTDGVAFSEIGRTGPNIRSYSSTALKANKLYYYRVRAFNNGGNSAYSPVASARTNAR